jgi:hypothetical protein
VKPTSLLAGLVLSAAAAGLGVRAAYADAPTGFVPAASAFSPLSGIVRAGGAPLGGATVLVRAVVAGVTSQVRILKTEPDGTWVLPDAARGLYTVMTLVPGFRPAIARVLHGSTADALSFVRLDLEKPAVLPASPLGAADPWIARAVTRGDVLRDVPTVLAALDDPEPSSDAPPLRETLAHTTTTTLPVRASVASSAGFGAAGAGNVSRTTLDVRGSAGESLRWGFGGQYSHLVPLEGTRTGDASQIAVDVAAGSTQMFHVSTRRQNLPIDDVDTSRFATHSVDWSGAMGERSNASVSARVISESRVFQSGPAADLFARDSSTVDVNARYRTDFDNDRYVRLGVGYRSESMDIVSGGGAVAGDRETRIGAAAGLRVFDFVVLEGGATGDFSARSRGVTPEVTLAFETKNGWRLYSFASRRYEVHQEDPYFLPLAGTDEADLTRLSRGLYRAGLHWQARTGESFTVEASRRELNGTYRLLFDQDFLDRLDSLYFFPGDAATEISSSGTWHIGAGLDGRIAARVGRIAGTRNGSVERDDASYSVAEGAVRIGATKTSLGVGYRVVAQSLERSGTLLHNDLQAVDFSLAQTLPVPPLLRALESEWRALFSVEFGHRREGSEEEKTNRRFAGGLAFSF